MKLAPLLARFLYTHNRMDLPGLGSFHREKGPLPETDDEAVPGVHFVSNPSIRQSPELVQFISTETGKMKALASADLASHLELALQFLNIGKAFNFEGIGSLSRQKDGSFVFTAGTMAPESLPVKEKQPAADEEGNSGIDYKKILYGRKFETRGAKSLFLVATALGLGVAIWGGYSLYKNGQRKNTTAEVTAASVEEEPAASSAVMFTSGSEPAREQPQTSPPPAVSDEPSQRKFVLETAGAKRAFARYQRLKSFQWKVEMETSDSVLYKLYVMVPVPLSDTTRVIDSLTRMNGKQVVLEN